MFEGTLEGLAVMDTSGSMDRERLGRAMGAIASYAEAYDMPRVRMVVCDAQPYDRDFIAPMDLRGGFPVKGRCRSRRSAICTSEGTSQWGHRSW